MTPALIAAPVLLFGLSLAAVLPVLVKLLRRCRADEITPEWLENFSVTSYYPMQRLLCHEDFQFLVRQPGFDVALYRKFRKDRLQIFRQYLNRMIGDFNRLHAIARLLLARNTHDRSELLIRLIWIKIRFSCAVFEAEGNYLLCCLGLHTLRVHRLIAQLEEMSVQLRILSFT